jgi:adenylate cyclase
MAEQEDVTAPLLSATAQQRKRPKPLPTDQTKRLRFAELLLGISRKMAGKATLDEVLAELVEVTTAELNCERGTIFLNDPMSNELVSRSPRARSTGS